MFVPTSSVTALPLPPGRAAIVPPRSRRLARWPVKAAVSEVSRVRARLRRTLVAWGVPPEPAEALLLIATELLSNAVVHAGGPAGRTCLTVALRGGRLRLDVADGDPRLPRFTQCADPGPDPHVDPSPDPHADPGPDPHADPSPDPHADPSPDAHADLGVDADAEGGRGLAIVRFLVDEAGGRLEAFRVPTGKVVRIRVPAA